MKLIYSNFNKDTGESEIIIQNKYGRFSGKAKIHPKDQEHKSNFVGYRLAQNRAQIKFLQTKCKQQKIMLKTIQNFNKELHKYCSFIDPKIQHRINLKLRDYNNNIKNLKLEISQLEEDLKNSIKIRDKILKWSKLNKNI